MANMSGHRGRRPRISLALALLTGVSVFTFFTVLAGYRAAPHDGSDFSTVAASDGSNVLTLKPSHGQATDQLSPIVETPHPRSSKLPR